METRPIANRLGCSRHSRLISVIIPTLREAANLPTLVRGIDRALSDKDYEVLIIDDSSGDGTIEVCQELAEQYPVVLHTRRAPTGGLSGAVLCGFSLARGAILAMMDADLQHPPECLPSLLQPILSGEADFVLGSRYVRGGRILDDWGVLRRLTSTVATILAGPLVRGIHDPMSGFFAMRREIWEQAQHLDPLGYKIALELLCKCPIRKIKEVPITFALRQRGDSKLSFKQQIMFLRHLIKLYLWRHSLAPTAIAPLKPAEGFTKTAS